MARPPAMRSIGDLTFPEVAQRLRETSILCLPLGATEQHGPHLPLDTDVTVARELTRRIVTRWGDELDLWQLPTVSISLSREHDWAPGTLSVDIQTFVALMRDLARSIVRALPSRNLAIINGHGGNRGLLDNLIHELRGDFALNTCVLHPFDLARIEAGSGDVHGGKSETSLMLALDPGRVRRELIPAAPGSADNEAIAALIFDRGASFPWRTDDPRLAASGVIGDAAGARAELGQSIIDGVVARAEDVLRRLLENQRLTSRKPRPSPAQLPVATLKRVRAARSPRGPRPRRP
jgi:creatinine amidohydrolase/Fe(II)-dependent formamide hydrolase-like protein